MSIDDVSEIEVGYAQFVGRAAVRRGDMHYWTRRIWWGEHDARWLFLTPWSGFGYQLSIGEDGSTYTNSWYYEPDRADDAWRHVLGWDGKGEPSGWFRHPSSGRRRPGGDPSKQFHQA